MTTLSDVKIEAEDGSLFYCHKCILFARLGKNGDCVGCGERKVLQSLILEAKLLATYTLATNKAFTSMRLLIIAHGK